MYRDLVVPLTETPGDADAIRAGIDMARVFGAHLTLLVMVGPPPSIGLAPLPSAGGHYGRLRAQAEVRAARVRARLEGEGLATEVRIVESLLAEPGRVAAQHAHYADLALVAGAAGDAAAAGAGHACFGALLVESGRPVLVVPPCCPAVVPPARIVVAWRPTREATRALHDAMPLLLRAEQVDVLAIDDARGASDPRMAPCAEIATHLAHHGVRADVVVRDAGSRGISGVLVEHARDTAAQMIVAGGYGHSRLREWAMGGVTQELLLTAPVPVLFSH